MPIPATTGQLRARISEMEIGDYIVWGSNGINYYFSDQPEGNERPITGASATSLPYSNTYWYAIKVAKGLLVSDRIIEHSVSWDSLNSTKRIQGVNITAGNIIPIMTSSTSPEGEVIFSDEQTNFEAFRAFDKKLGSNKPWMTNNGVNTGYIGYRFTSPRRIVKYSINSRTDNSSFPNSPKSWTFEGSQDGVDWEVIDTQINIVSWTSTGEEKSFQLKNNKDYIYYRVNITESNSSLVAIAELKMFETLGKIRSLTGGVAYADNNGNKSMVNNNNGAFPKTNEWDKYIADFPLEKIQEGKTLDDIFHCVRNDTNNIPYTFCQETPVIGINNVNGTPSDNISRVCRVFWSQNTHSHVTSDSKGIWGGFRPVFEYNE
jgi:hypothetical protein